MKKTALLALLLMLTLVTASASALTLTGYETESVTRYWEESRFFPRMEALTGVSMEPKTVLEQDEYDKLLAGMLRGSIPADVLFKAELTRDEERALLDAGAIIDLSSLLEENMPNLSALLEAHPSGARSSRCRTGASRPCRCSAKTSGRSACSSTARGLTSWALTCPRRSTS